MEAVSLWQSLQLQTKEPTRPGPEVGWESVSWRVWRKDEGRDLRRRVVRHHRNRLLWLHLRWTSRHD